MKINLILFFNFLFMKKIGIITIVKVNNYGAELQAFALQRKLRDLGYDAEIIDYLFYKHNKHIKTAKSKPWISIGFKNQIKEILSPVFYNIKTALYRNSKRIREKKFDEFHFFNTQFSKTFFSIDELYNAQLDYDVFIVGSDQVWNPSSNTNLDPYFLTFAPKNKKRISYASSFGVAEVPPSTIPFYKERLQQFTAISVRESQAVDLVNKILDKPALHVLDPTLLLSKNEWSRISKTPDVKKPYILLYILSPSDFATRLAESIAIQTGWKIVRICKEATREDKNKTIKNIIDAGPSEFIGWFLNASFIITNSFHGTAFSINFNKPFYTIAPSHKTNNSRQQSLLNLLGLEKRLLKEDTILPEGEPLYLDFTDVNILLKKERKKSIDYLISNINS
jgi:polysaccharide pyruvyl transferase WcaK-like protein